MRRATRGGAAFAFASVDGIKLLFGRRALARFSERHPFEVVVGIDKITNVAALHAFEELANQRRHLSVQVFLHNRPGAVFHPKLCWFRTGVGGYLITGSGNLTPGGLRDNWEAFTVTSLTSGTATAVETHWTDWKTRNRHRLRALDDREVLVGAGKNLWIAEGGAASGAGSNRSSDGLNPGDAVLIAEIPRSGNRWNQANFDLDTFQNFFNVKLGRQRRVSFYQVGSDGTLAEAEVRPAVAVRSNNYRFQFSAGRGTPYPERGRPIGVFIRANTGTYRYQLLMPGDPDHAAVLNLLQQNYFGPPRQMRRVIVTLATLRSAWPNSPLSQGNNPGDL